MSLNKIQLGQNYPYKFSDRADKTQASQIDKNSDALRVSIQHLVEKQNALLAYERLAADREKSALKEQNSALREQLRNINGEAEDYEVSDNLNTYDPSSLTNLDKSNCGLSREGLQQLIRQLVDIKEVKTINLSGNGLTDEIAGELEQLVVLDRRNGEESEVGFVGIDLSFNELSQASVQKVFKFGVLHNHLNYVNMEGNILMAEFPGMGVFIADIIMAGSSGSKDGKKKRPARSRKGGAVAVSVKPASYRKLVSLRMTLFDFKKEVDDQSRTADLPLGGAGGGRGKKPRQARGAKGKGKGKGKVESGSNPMNALAFVRKIFSVGGVAGKNPGRKKKPPPGRAKAKKGDKEGGKMNPETIRKTLFKLITTDEVLRREDQGHMDGDVFYINASAEDFETAMITFNNFEGKPLDVPIEGKGLSDSGDTLLCHAVRHGKVDHIRVLLERHANPTQPNKVGSTPSDIANYCERSDIVEMLRTAAMDYDPSALDFAALGDEASQAAGTKKPPIESLALVHAKLCKETITILSSNLHGLVNLDISGGFVGAYGAQCIGKALLRKPQTLLSLNVSSNSIGCAGVACIASSLQFNNTLTSLDVSSNDIKDDGAKSLSRGIKTNDVLASLNVGDNPISAKAVKSLLGVVRKCESLRTVKGTEQLLAPVKLRSMVEHNAEGREGSEDEGGVFGAGGQSESEDEEDEVEACFEATNMSASNVASQTGGGEWDCLKIHGVALNGPVQASANVKLGKRIGGRGAKKPVKGYTIALARKRFGLNWMVLETVEKQGGDDNMGFLAFSQVSFKEFEGFAGDEVSLWIRVDPLGKGNMEGVVRSWNVTGAGKIGMREGGGGTVLKAWN
mmetsp:Transcript_21497/g.40434  ORF Transcript_21497/g.40434 Transcript_21497/m.40434 type:complete len:851 (+) Transcript_21497:251-2803(+)|eukprot:CAMPEP_0182518762 /NCGR_PEP_ID=MMETSP1321-20130603/44743_1 /TAXON_ID=91990 /ORGANISM="Bolidomonas sp., Strain RCC1657" /LENGTH=850 /DNA_ID=CAMNT_0024726703 /DNA_START=232 /DNA_END=2787 /DNA_ORIENTATION=+